MVEYDDLVYLDVQKTGTNTVRQFLKRFAKSRYIGKKRHAPVDQRALGKAYLISVRDPFDQYKSLYKFGITEGGAIRAQFGRAGLAYLYDADGNGFADWLSILLDYDRGADVLMGKAFHPAMRYFGLLSLRFISLDMPGPRTLLDRVTTRADVWPLYSKNRLHDVMLRTETLTADLCAFVRGPHGHLCTDPEAAETYILTTAPKNTSPPLNAPFDLPAEVIDLLQDREWFYYDYLGYSRRASGSATALANAPAVN